MRKPLLLLLSLLSFSVALLSQTEDAHHITEKETGIYEIITSGIYAYSFAHREGLAGSEVHLTYWFTHTWGTGLSYTAKFEHEEILHDIALLGSVNPTRWLTLNTGLNWALASKNREFSIGAYVETEINIRPTKWFHFGPVLGAVISKESEGTVGFHLGFEF